MSKTVNDIIGEFFGSVWDFIGIVIAAEKAERLVNEIDYNPEDYDDN